MSGNGADLGQVIAMLQSVLVAQEGMWVAQDGFRNELGEVRSELGEARGELRELREGMHTRDRKVDGLADQVAGLRQALDDHHNAVIGHGVLIGGLDERVTRLERDRGGAASG